VGAVGLFAMRFLPAFGFLPNPLAKSSCQTLLPNPLAKSGRTGNPIRVNGAVDAAAFVTGIKIIMLSGV
jgi:hypothetical protein